ncbi:hypothetical protein A2U01_0053747, partial [Trifolium medium]|nr:hypothetical protein [Trifolium medium]
MHCYSPWFESLADMGPKKSASGVTKKRKTDASSSRASQPFDATRFLEPDQFERYKNMENRKIWAEKHFEINPEGVYRRFLDIIDNRGWGKGREIRFDREAINAY